MASGTMYKVKPIYNNTPLANVLPTNMYKMKNLHEDVANEVVMESPECEELKYRQQDILKDLEKLKTEIFQIGSEIGVESDGSLYSKAKEQLSSCSPVSINNPITLAVKASPQDPPLSLILLQKMLQQHGLLCCSIAHIHSSLTVPLPENLRDIFGNTTSATHLTNSVVSLRLIWKDQILAPNLMVSVADQSAILGEVNILRYLSRFLLPDLYSGLGPLDKTNVDTWLSVAMESTASENVKEGKAFIQNLNSCLGKHKWLVGGGPTLADIYCSIVVIKMHNGNALPNKVKTWLTTCRKELPGFKDVEILCN